MKKAIIIGASSGIGAGLAKLMANDGYELGITARRIELLEKLKSELSEGVYTKFMDVSKPQEAMTALDELIAEMDGVDLIIISSGTGYINKDLDWKLEQATIDLNVSGVTAIINTAVHYFAKKKSGHLVAISSIAGLCSDGDSPAYNASKAYLSNYLKGIRKKSKKEKLRMKVTDIKPGFVDTAMAQGEGLFWVMPVETVCKQIYKAIRKKKKSVIITKRWRMLAPFVKMTG